MCVGTGDVVAEYYQRQVEMLEGFNEMDALADHGFLPGMSKVGLNTYYSPFSLGNLLGSWVEEIF